MEISKKPWPILSVCGFKNRIDTNPDFQRPAVWSTGQKQLLIDTILRGYDIPKLYWRKISKAPEKYEVVDGQQRLRTIFEFHAGEFNLAKDADDIDGVVVAKMCYADLPEDLRLTFDNYALDVIVLSETSEDEVREMFLRLQNGTTLKAQEKRNAMPGTTAGGFRTQQQSLLDSAHHRGIKRAFDKDRFAGEEKCAVLFCHPWHEFGYFFIRCRIS